MREGGVRRACRRAAWAALCAGAAAAPLAAQELPAGARPVVGVSPASSPVRVDGVLDEAAWADVPVVEVAYEWSPGDNAAAPVRTECRLTFTPEHLYLGCLAADPEPGRIRAKLVERDRPLQDDYVGLLLDPFDDQRQGFLFRVNPMGVQVDGAYTAGEEDLSWDAIWTSAARITAQGYVVEVAIPFKSLRFPRGGDVQRWGFIVERHYPRSVRHRLRSVRTDADNSCLLCQAARVEGLSGITPASNVELTPTVVVARDDEWNGGAGEGRLSEGPVRAEPGLTARWGITPSLSLSGTLNPDFSQVEADAPQLRVNERFALFFPEKRPFFLEGAEYFATPVPVVFTRTVADPTSGVKLTGKEGPSAVGLFVAHDRVNTVLLPGNQGSETLFLPGDVATGVFRYRRDVGEASTLGVLYTGRAGEAYQGHTAGVDGLVRLTASNSVEFQLVRSLTDYPDSLAERLAQRTGRFGGGNAYVQVNHNTRDWNAWANYRSVGPGFRSDAGYVPRADLRGFAGSLERVVWGKPGGWFTRLALATRAERIENHDGQLTDQTLTLGGSYTGPRQSTLAVSVHHHKELFGGRMYDLFWREAQFEIRPNGWLSLLLYVDASEQIDYANAREAEIVNPYASVNLWVGRHFNLDLSHTWPRLATRQNDEIFRARLSQARLLYSFDARTSLRATLQHSAVTYNPDVYLEPVEPEPEIFLGQLLFSYQVNPQTVLFLGYSDDRSDFSSGGRLVQVGRSLFFKVGYAWRP